MTSWTSSYLTTSAEPPLGAFEWLQLNDDPRPTVPLRRALAPNASDAKTLSATQEGFHFLESHLSLPAT